MIEANCSYRIRMCRKDFEWFAFGSGSTFVIIVGKEQRYLLQYPKFELFHHTPQIREGSSVDCSSHRKQNSCGRWESSLHYAEWAKLQSFRFSLTRILTSSILQILTVLSSEADAIYSPSLAHAISDIPSVWPCSVSMNSPVTPSQSLINLSAPFLHWCSG